MLGRQGSKCPVWIRVELDEHQVPYLNALRRPRVHEASPLFLVEIHLQIHVQLAAWPAGASVAHHPEIVLLVPIYYVEIRVEPH